MTYKQKTDISCVKKDFDLELLQYLLAQLRLYVMTIMSYGRALALSPLPFARRARIAALHVLQAVQQL